MEVQIYILVSFTLHENSDSLKSELEYLKEKFSRTWLWWNDTFIIFSNQKRRLFTFWFWKKKMYIWGYILFSSKVKVKIRTVVINKKYINKKMQLNVALAREISNFINENKEYINSFDKVVIYYDNGQETLAIILDTLFASYPNAERRIEFDHKKKRLFQVSDMLTVIDKLDYKRKNNIPFTKAEKYFFNGKDFRHIINL